ncbi:hypothetical protein SLEP1_g19092 [Rubroshorea leprosula]|nr:hypothetical protein SLEP1_g19092 [Rubroshorea leprosula]
MEIVAPNASVIVPEVLKRNNYKRWSIFLQHYLVVLKRNNYKRWSIFLQHYLVGQDLWDVVEFGELSKERNMWREWIKKNALALHAIKISCGEEKFDQIKEMKSAKDVWDALAATHAPPVQVIVEPPLGRREGLGNLTDSRYETLTNAISSGELRQVRRLFRHSNPRSTRIFENGYTALHFAVYNGKSKIVDHLTKYKLSKEDLETKDYSGSTALSIAAFYGVEKSIAQSLVRKNDNLLTIPDKDGKIPVELACSTIQEGLIRYLYLETPLKSLNVDKGASILHECIIRKMVDIVFDLLHHFPELADRSCSLGLISTLAQTPFPFFGRSNLSFWELCIYNCIIVKAHVIKEDEHRSCVKKMRDFFQPFREVIQPFFDSFVDMILLAIVDCPGRIQENEETNQETEETNIENQQTSQEMGQTNQETNGDAEELSFKDKCGKVTNILQVAWGIIVSIPIVMLLCVIDIAILIPLALLMDLVGLIIVTLLILVRMLSWFLARDLYKIKLMDVYASEVIQLICKPLSKLDQNQSVQSTAEEATIQAIKNGIPDIVKEIINANLLRSSTDPEDSRSRIQKIFAFAVKHRQEEVAHFLYESEKEKNMLFTTDEDGNNTLHLAAKLPPNYQSGYIHAAALQLQSELRWFKAVKEIVPRAYREGKNKDNETPLELFVREHKQLLKEAEKWVKKTAESSTVVGALIITIMFAVAFSAPGGNDQSTGFPVLLHKTPTPFMIFMASDAISLFTATSSVIMFLGILTSHHSDEDYRKSFLLIMGLTSLFVSIATMTIAFCAALFIMLQGQGGLGLVIPITLLAGIPLVCYVLLQFPLLVEILGLTFSSNIFGKKGTSFADMIASGMMSGWTADMIALPMRGLRG